MVEHPLQMIYSMGSVVEYVNASTVLNQVKNVDSNIQAINFTSGSYKEVAANIAEWQKGSRTRNIYPLIILFTDKKEQYGKDGYNGTSIPHLAIAYSSKATYTAAERYTNGFIPILYPLYHELLRQIDQSGYYVIQSVRKIIHTKYDRPNWQGTNNVFSEPLDAIEISNIQLKLTTNAIRTIPAVNPRFHDDVFDDLHD
jgi:hypothetical protein